MSAWPKLRWNVLIATYLACLAITGCPSNGQNITGAEPVHVQIANENGNSALLEIIASGRVCDTHLPYSRWCRDDLKDFYIRSGYHPVWVSGGEATPQALAVLQLFRRAYEKGLVPDEYEFSNWQDRLSRMRDSPSGPEVAAFDAALTASLMQYVRDLHFGRVNPSPTSGKLYIGGEACPISVFLHERIAHAPDPESAIAVIEPKSSGYWKALQALHAYRRMAIQEDGERLPVPGKPIKPGQMYSEKTTLVRLLRRFGDLPADATVGEGGTYEGVLVDAVKRFQVRHGQIPDGVLDSELVNALNVPLAKRVRQLELALERWRWLPHSSLQPRLIINLPEFRLHAFETDGREAFDRKIIVGGARGRRSPLFERTMKYLVFRPHWDVPRSIQRHEIVPHLEKDREYIANHHYQVLTPTGTVVTEARIDDDTLNGLRTGHLQVRQKPGTANALGLVKFIFPNEQNVYLHDTDAPQLFSRERRDLSHGCIRVEGAAELAAWVLKYNPGWDIERVRATMQGNSNNVTVHLATPVSVIINYGTVTIDSEGTVFFFNDVYGYDAELDRQLAHYTDTAARQLETLASQKEP
jgi:murein L,D-transpeptidase YcbB/YkuD